MVWPLPVTDLLFVGRAAAKVLGQYGISTIGDLAAFDRQALISLLGKQGGQLWSYANGLENSPVAPAGLYVPPKSVGNGQTFPRNLVTRDEIHLGLALLADEVAMRLRQHHLKATTLQVTIRDPHFKDICRQRPLEFPTCTARELTRVATEIVNQCWSDHAPIRALTVTAHNLVGEDETTEQIGLFDGDAPKRRDKTEKLERTMDALRAKYGHDILLTGTMCKPAEDQEETVPF